MERLGKTSHSGFRVDGTTPRCPLDEQDQWSHFSKRAPTQVPAERPAQKPGSGWPEQCPPMSLGEQEDLLVLVLLLVREFRLVKF